MESSSLSATQPLFVLVVGLPGSGKTFFARQFAESYKFFYIDSGRIESELESISNSHKDIRDISNKIVSNTLEQALKVYRHIIVEGQFGSEVERSELLSMATKAGFGTLVVWVQTDEETAEYRALNRDRRRPDDKYSLKLNEDEFLQIKKKFQKLNTKKETFVVVSGKHDFKSQGVVVLKKIASMYVRGMDQSGKPNSPQARTIIR